MTQFSHISPTAFLKNFAAGRSFHLLLAHLVEEDPDYRFWYAGYKKTFEVASPSMIPRKIVSPETGIPSHTPLYILDNSAFEMYKQGREMYPSSKLIEMGHAIKADYIVLSDYPGEHSQKTINAALELAPKFLSEGFGTFFAPQSEIGDLEDLINAYEWAVSPIGRRFVDYIGVSILGVPNAYGVEKNNKLQRFVSRYYLMRELYSRGILQKMRDNGQKLHFLGMVDGPKEIQLVEPFLKFIDTWDSSAAVWAGLNGLSFDNSPTGLLNGKFEHEVDFNLPYDAVTSKQLDLARENINTIDRMLRDDPLTRLS